MKNTYKKLCHLSARYSLMKNGIWCFWTRLKIHSRLGISLRCKFELLLFCLLPVLGFLSSFFFVVLTLFNFRSEMQIMVSEYEAVCCLRTDGNLFSLYLFSSRDRNKNKICGDLRLLSVWHSYGKLCSCGRGFFFVKILILSLGLRWYLWG